MWWVYGGLYKIQGTSTVIENMITSNINIRDTITAKEKSFIIQSAKEKEAMNRQLMEQKQQEEIIRKLDDLNSRLDSIIEAKANDLSRKSTQHIASRGNTDKNNAKFLLTPAVVDENYKGVKIELSPEHRDLAERIVMGEAGGEGFEGQVLVAQAIRDAMTTFGYSVPEVWKNLSYTKNINKKPSEEVKRAVSFVFDEGGSAVQHRIIYFYAPKIVKSKFHESQIFVIEYGGHRVFDRREK